MTSLDDPLDVESGGADVDPVEQAAVAAAHGVQEQQQRVEQVVAALKHGAQRSGSHDCTGHGRVTGGSREGHGRITVVQKSQADANATHNRSHWIYLKTSYCGFVSCSGFF